MTIEEIMELKKNDAVKFGINTYVVTSYQVLNTFHLIGFRNIKDTSNKNLMIIKLYDMSIRADIFIDERMTDYSIDFIIKLSEKEVLEIQLKEAEELVQKETARVDSIKAKIEELSKPKLKIGGLYSFLIGQTKHVGVLTRIDKYYYYIITSELNRYTFTYGSGPFEYANFREITNPKYSHIGPTILEFVKLNPENFQ